MQFWLLCSFVCFSTVFLGTVFAGDGFSDKEVVKPTEDFLKCHFTQVESKSFFAPHSEEIKDKEENVVDIFDLPGYLRWPSLGGVTEEEEGMRTALTIQAVVNDIYKLEGTPENTPIIVFASHGLKGVAAMRFAIKQKIEKPKSQIVIFLPSKRVQISVSDAFSLKFQEELEDCKTKHGLPVYVDLTEFQVYLTANLHLTKGFIVEGLFGIGFKSEYGLNPEAAPILDMFTELYRRGGKVISVDVPALYNVDAGLLKKKPDSQETIPIDLQERVGAKDYSYRQRKDHELCEPKLKGPAVQIKDQIYKPFAVIFIGFLKPCYEGLNALQEVKYIYLGGHFLDPLALAKFLELKSIQTRCPKLDVSMFPTYKQDTVLFHRLKQPVA